MSDMRALWVRQARAAGGPSIPARRGRIAPGRSRRALARRTRSCDRLRSRRPIARNESPRCRGGCRSGRAAAHLATRRGSAIHLRWRSGVLSATAESPSYRAPHAIDVRADHHESRRHSGAGIPARTSAVSDTTAWPAPPAIGEMKIRPDAPVRQVGQGDDGLDLIRVGIDALILGLEFGGPHAQPDTPAIEPHTHPVDSAHLLRKFDFDGRRTNQTRGRNNYSASMFPRTPGGFFENRRQLPVMVCVFQRSPAPCIVWRARKWQGERGSHQSITPPRSLPRLHPPLPRRRAHCEPAAPAECR